MSLTMIIDFTPNINPLKTSVMFNVTIIPIPQSADEKPVPVSAVLGKDDMLDVVSSKVDSTHYAVISKAESSKSVFDS